MFGLSAEMKKWCEGLIIKLNVIVLVLIKIYITIDVTTDAGKNPIDK